MAITVAQIQAEVSVSGTDTAKQQLQSVSDKVDSTGGSFKSALGNSISFAAGLAGQAFSFLKSQVGDAINVILRHEDVMAQTAQVLKSTHDVSGMTAQSIDNLAVSLSKVTPFADDTIQSGENLLLTFTGLSSQVLPETTQAMIDMSQSMGQDVKSSAIMLGKALNDPATGLTALTRVGVTFSAQEKEQIKTMLAHNNTIGAQKVMLKELETEFGGSATAAGKTLTGQIQILKNNMDILTQQIGDALLPLITPLVTRITGMATAFMSWATSGHAVDDVLKFVKTHAEFAIPILAGLGAIVLTVLIPTFAAWAAEVIAATWPLLAIGAAVGGVVFIFMKLYDTFSQVRAAVSVITGVFQGFGDQVSGIFDAFNRNAQESTLQSKLASISNTIDQKQQLIAQYEDQKAQLASQMELTHNAVVRAALQTKIDTINAAEQQAQGVIAAAQKQKQGVQQQLEQIDPVAKMHALQQKETTVNAAISQAQESIQAMQTQRFGLEKEMSQTTDSTQKQALATQIAAIDAAIKQKDGVLKAAQDQRAGIEKSMQAQQAVIAHDRSGNVLVNMWQGVVSAVQAVGNFFSNVFWPALQHIGAWIASVFAPVWQDLVSTWQTQLLPAFQQIGDALQTITPLFELIAAVVGGVVVGAFGFVVGSIEGVIKALAGIITGLITTVSGIVRIITGIIQVFANMGRTIYDLVTGNFSHLRDDVAGIWHGLVNIATGIWQAISGAFQAGIGAVVGFVTGAVQGIIGWFQHLWDMLVGHSIIPDMINGIIAWFASLPGKLFDLIQKAVQWIIDRFTDLKNGAVAAVQGMINWVVGLAQGFASTLSGIWTTIKNDFNTVMKSVGQIATDIWNGIVSTIKGAINDVIDLINGFIKGINGIGIDIGPVHIHPHIPTIPHLATGGGIAAGGWARVGEEGPEDVWLPTGAQVIPNSRLGGQGQQPIIVNPPPIYLDGRVLANGLLPHLANGIRYGTGARAI